MGTCKSWRVIKISCFICCIIYTTCHITKNWGSSYLSDSISICYIIAIAWCKTKFIFIGRKTVLIKCINITSCCRRTINIFIWRCCCWLFWTWYTNKYWFTSGCRICPTSGCSCTLINHSDRIIICYSYNSPISII